MFYALGNFNMNTEIELYKAYWRKVRYQVLKKLRCNKDVDLNMNIIQVFTFVCLIVASCTLTRGRHSSSISALLRMRRSTSDLSAMSSDTQHRMDETIGAYCRRVYTLLPRPDKHEGPLGVCQTSADYVLPMLSLPPLTVFKSNKPVTKTTLASVLLAVRRLNHTLTRLAAVGTKALLRPRRRGGMAACVSLTDSGNPCQIICSASKTPERQLYCDLRAQVLPRLRNLVQLLQTHIPDAKDSNPDVTGSDVDSTRPQSVLRLYAVAVLEYAQRQMALIKKLF